LELNFEWERNTHTQTNKQTNINQQKYTLQSYTMIQLGLYFIILLLSLNKNYISQGVNPIISLDFEKRFLSAFKK